MTTIYTIHQSTDHKVLVATSLERMHDEVYYLAKTLFVDASPADPIYVYVHNGLGFFGVAEIRSDGEMAFLPRVRRFVNPEAHDAALKARETFFLQKGFTPDRTGLS